MADPTKSERAKQAWATRRANAAAAGTAPKRRVAPPPPPGGSGVRDAFGNEAPTTRAPQRAGRPPLRDGVRGRSGEILTRGRVSGHGYVNEFDVPADVRDPDWDLYWARSSTHGKPDAANLNELYDNGWRPASPKNYGRIMPDMRGKESIERDGLILMERPMALTYEALDEQRRDALELRNIQAEAFGGRNLPKGFDQGHRTRDGKFDASKNIKRGRFEQSPREAQPAYEYAGPGDDD